ncbi:hypothetical protein M9979_07145 [Sphingomonas sp. RP10(2022)]|uniref:Uncharacterized protein n=1 Tax=Sphingomonas liriopis TaxID=2949094 RepID=A0A9X2HXK4_9SPHN|nr:hypothetical protein [Sphingomonas liriopis]MCP3734645.1 hypothetical protein [Sphingomonas liriopis]
MAVLRLGLLMAAVGGAISGYGAAAPSAARPLPRVVLRSDGIASGDAHRSQGLRFGTAKSAAVAAASVLLGTPLGSQVSPDCGIGHPMTLVTYKGGFTLQFLKEKLVGWSLDRPADPRFRTAAGITIGSTLAAVRKGYPNIDVDDGSLGPMFTRLGDPSGFLDGLSPNSHVTGLYAGRTCMVW